MSVTEVKELPTGRGGKVDLITNNGEVTRVFRVRTNNAYDDFTVIRYSGLIPALGSGHPNDLNLIAKRYDLVQKVGSFVWEFKVHYDNIPPGQSGLPKLAEEWQPHPLLRRVQIEGKTVKRTVPWTKWYNVISTRTITAYNGGVAETMDATETVIENSAHDPFEGLEKQQSDFTWEVTINIYPLPFWILDYEDSINNAAVTLRGLPTPIPKWKLMCSGFRHTDLLQENVTPFFTVDYYRVQFELSYRRDSWIRAIADRGFRKLVGGAQKHIMIDGVRPSVPVPLSGTGTVQTSPTAASIEYHWGSPGPEKDFSVFNLL